MLSFPQDVLIVQHWTDCMTIGDNKKTAADSENDVSNAVYQQIHVAHVSFV